MKLPREFADDERVVTAFQHAQDVLENLGPEGGYELSAIDRGEDPGRFVFWVTDGTVDSPIVVVLDGEGELHGMTDLVPTPSGPYFDDLVDLWPRA